ncbi:PAS domain S-box protein [Rhodospira trueperi]|uniref:histidine kinase n=1 Tax=Rhodospira trueperi TaxID=69960 RepID=A0A1G6WI22_9PROT|nr:PAS domain S-box protein [Rhodospira trueperi]SDD65353.1 PAS domain S-box-containing protein [Rhodospira trueperi]
MTGLTSPGLSDAVLAAIPLPVFVKDETGRYIACNDALAAFLGCGREDVLGRTAFDLLPSDLAEAYQRADDTLRATGGPQRYESDVESPIHGPRRVVFNKTLVTPPDGGPPLIVGIIEDITDLAPSRSDAPIRDAVHQALTRFSADALKTSLAKDPAPFQTLLADIGAATGTDRTRFDRFDEDDPGVVALSLHWIRPEVFANANQEAPQPLRVDALPWVSDRLRAGQIVNIPDVALLPDPAGTDRASLSRAGVKALLTVPIRLDRIVIGLFGVGSLTAPRAWTEEEISLLRLTAHTLAQALDRDRIETRLRVSEQNFRALFESMQDMLFVAGLDGRLLHTNAAAARLLGYPREVLCGMLVTDLHDPALLEQTATLRVQVAQGEETTFDLPLHTSAGRTLPARTHAWRGIWNGQPCIFAVSHDMTAISEAELWFKRLFRNNPAPMALATASDATLVDVNDAFLATTGYDREEVIGQSTAALNLPVDPDAFDAASRQLREKGRVAGVELRIRRKDGGIRYGLFYGELIAAHDRHVFLTVITDVTKRKRTEEALAKSEERLRLAFEAASDGIWDWDIANDTIDWNPRCFAMLGFHPGAFPVSVQTWRDLLHPDDREVAAATVAAHINEGKAWALEFRLRRTDGTWLWVLGRGRPVAWDEAGQPTRAVGTHTDIDGMKQVQQSLIEARQAAEYASLAKSEFLAGMSHELRTPLNSILGFSSALLTPGPTETRELKTRNYLQHIHGSGEHLLQLINDILDLSAVEAGKMVLQDGPIDVVDVCRNCMTMVSKPAAKGNVALIFEAGPRPPVLHADERRVRQVLLNLLSNSVKFTPSGGRVTLSIHERDDGTLALVVTDTGIGMDTAALDKAMRPFEQVENVLSRRHDGIGLGLPLTARLMDLHGGTLCLDSEPGTGTTATATFPAARVRPAD